MTILVTGAGGFIGKNVCGYLAANNYDVIAMYRKNMPMSKNIKIYQQDLRDEIAIHENVDAIIHLASQMRGSNMEEYLDNTVLPMKNLIAFAEKNKVETFIGISSIAVYGQVSGCINETSDRVNPQDYGMAKYISERLLEDSEIENRIILRLPRILGPEIDYSYPWLPKLSKSLFLNEDVYYYNPYLEYNNMLYVEDFAKFLLLVLNEKEQGLKKFVLGAREPLPIYEIVNILKEELRSSSKIRKIESNKKNTCHLIDITKALGVGFSPMPARELLKRFAYDTRRDLGNG